MEIENQFKGSQGFWHTNKDNPERVLIYSGSTGRRIATIKGHKTPWVNREEAIYNTQVIVCAPELLKALQGLVSWSAHLPQLANPELESARNVINKALGL